MRESFMAQTGVIAATIATAAINAVGYALNYIPQFAAIFIALLSMVAAIYSLRSRRQDYLFNKERREAWRLNRYCAPEDQITLTHDGSEERETQNGVRSGE